VEGTRSSPWHCLAGCAGGQGRVGGDWYDAFVLPSGQLGLVVGDVAGSGLGAAVIMGSGSTMCPDPGRAAHGMTLRDTDAEPFRAPERGV
jgi:hypothetical protein